MARPRFTRTRTPRRAGGRAQAAACVAAVLAVASGLAGCAGRDQTAAPAERGRRLEVTPQTIGLQPGATGMLAFTVLTPSGLAVAGETVTFTIVDDPDVPGVEAQ